MKYGDTLRQRSVPQWAYQNVAYDSIKRLIKEHTTPGKGKAVTIPGQDDSVEDNFEDQLFQLFTEQHDNVNLFVRSKSGEIDRRLDHINRQLHNIQLASWPPSIVPTRIPPSRLAKYGRLEEQALQAGEEIKLLSRFIAVQKTAFIKLLKKYRKWSGRTWLDSRWNTEVVASESSFTNFDLDPFFDHWADSLQEIRYAMGVGQSKSGLDSYAPSPALLAQAPKKSSQAVSRRLHNSLANAADVDFDAILASTPLGSEGSQAVYWVHPEQLVELQVLLLQHTRLAFPRSSPSGSATRSATPTATRRSSCSTPRRDSFFEREPTSGVVVFDDLEQYALLQNSVPIAVSEKSQVELPTAAAMTARWTNHGDLAISLRHLATSEQAGSVAIAAKIRSKHLAHFLDQDKELPYRVPSSADSNTEEDEGLQEARNWLSHNPSVKPLVGIFSRRSRFVNLSSGGDRGQWAMLDLDIKMRKVDVQDLQTKDWAQNLAKDAASFPYAVLKVRQEGAMSTDLIRLLDESHLTERVRGFSIFAHALWTCRRPESMTPPFWLPVLSGDIRKLPSQDAARRSRRAAVKTPQSSASGDREDIGSSSTAVSTGGESPFEPFLLPGARPKVKRNPTSGSGKRREMSQVANTRYWSEYDHPEEEAEEGYFIYINPDQADEEEWIPMKSTFKSMVGSVRKLFSSIRGKRKTIDDEHEPLLAPTRVDKDRFFASANDGLNIETSSDSDSEDDDDNALLNPRRRYGALPVLEPSIGYGGQHDQDAIGVLLASIISLFFSATLSVVLLVLTAVGRKRARGEVDLVVLAGTIISLTFAIAGLWGMLKRNLSIVRWIAGLSVFIGVLIIDVMQATMLFKNVLAAVPPPL